MSAPLTRREETLLAVARWYRDVADPMRTTMQADGGGVGPVMPREYNRTFREFEECMRLMRKTHRRLWWHFYERYIGSERVTKDVVRRGSSYQLPRNQAVLVGPATVGKRRDRRRREAALQIDRCVVEIWQPRVDLDTVHAATQWLSGAFVGEPFLPPDIVAAA